MADDLLRDFEGSWWACCRKGDAATVAAMLAGGREVLATTVDKDKRTGLHFACGVGSEECVKLLLQNGADVCAGDKTGYSPLHIAAGYLHRRVVRQLLEAGADPELEDKEGRSPLTLVTALRDSTPTSPEFFARRGQLQEVAKELDAYMFEDLQPAAVVGRRGLSAKEAAAAAAAREAARAAAGGAAEAEVAVEEPPLEFLIHWGDGSEDTWEPERNVADDVIADFEAGLQFAVAREVLAQRRSGAANEYLVAWEDGAEPSWQEEAQLSDILMLAWLDKAKAAREAKKRSSGVSAEAPAGSAA